MSDNIRWLDWAVELQSLAQAGLTYGKDDFDRERYQRIRTIAADIISQHSGLTAARVADLFCNESGYQTPKLDTRAAIIEDDKILLVQERDCRWALPGGWVDVNCSVRENITKEVKEEAGLDVVAERILALHDWHQHNGSTSAWHICKIFIQCRVLGGAFQPNNETLASGWVRARTALVCSGPVPGPSRSGLGAVPTSKLGPDRPRWQCHGSSRELVIRRCSRRCGFWGKP